MKDIMAFVMQCIKNNNLHAFYTCWAWRRLRSKVLKKDKHECQKHKDRGKYKKATTVHHVRHLREYPELALSETYVDEFGVEHRQLISLCNQCHEEEHPERRLGADKTEPLTPERW